MLQIWGRVPGLDEVVAHIDAVTLADVRAHAAHLACSAPAAMALYGPVEQAPSLDVLQQRRAA